MLLDDIEKFFRILFVIALVASFAFTFINVAIGVGHMYSVKSALKKSHRIRHGMKFQTSPMLTKHEVKFHFNPDTPEYAAAMKQALAVGRAIRGMVSFLAIFA